ncbi:FadR/GntR family transcriptional regulator, partial [Kushneria aurantia]
REAIAYLRSMGLVETRRGIGTRVISTGSETPLPARRIRANTLDDILHVLELRLTLEPRAAALAARRGDQARREDYQFHRAIIEAAHNPFFLSCYEPLSQEAIPRARLIATELDTASTQRYLEMVAQEHGAILNAILAHDSEGAREAVVCHFSRARETYAAYRS